MKPKIDWLIGFTTNGEACAHCREVEYDFLPHFFKIYNNNRPDQEENCVYMVQFDWSVEDDSGNDIYFYDTYEKALEKYQSIIAGEMDPNKSWVGEQAFDKDGNVNEDYDFQRTDNPNTEYHCWYVENTAESSWYSKVELTKKEVE